MYDDPRKGLIFHRDRARRWRTACHVLLFIVAMLACGLVFGCDNAPVEPMRPEVLALICFALILAAHLLVVLLNFVARRLGHNL